MVHADACVQKLREWRKKGFNVSVLNLRRAYFQVCAQIVAVPDSYPRRKEALSIAHGFWTQCSTIYYAGYC